MSSQVDEKFEPEVGDIVEFIGRDEWNDLYFLCEGLDGPHTTMFTAPILGIVDQVDNQHLVLKIVDSFGMEWTARSCCYTGADNRAWLPSNGLYNTVRWLSCAECGNVSFLDYLCPSCRA